MASDNSLYYCKKSSQALPRRLTYMPGSGICMFCMSPRPNTRHIVYLNRVMEDDLRGFVTCSKLICRHKARARVNQLHRSKDPRWKLVNQRRQFSFMIKVKYLMFVKKGEG